MRKEKQPAALLFAALILCGSSLSNSAAAQSTISPPPDPQAPLSQLFHGSCYCAKAAPGGNDQCHLPLACPILACNDDLDCDPGEFCMSDDNCCGIQLCAPSCGNCTVGAGEGVCGNFVVCTVSSIPTLSQWGLVLLGLLMTGTGGWVLRRDGLAARLAVLALLVAGLVSVAMAYSVIQGNRLCEDQKLTANPVEQVRGAQQTT